MYSLDIGPGWGLAEIDSEQELQFLKSQQQQLTNDRTYWVGGLADARGIIDYSQYSTTAGGNSFALPYTFSHIDYCPSLNES